MESTKTSSMMLYMQCDGLEGGPGGRRRGTAGLTKHVRATHEPTGHPVRKEGRPRVTRGAGGISGPSSTPQSARRDILVRAWASKRVAAPAVVRLF